MHLARAVQMVRNCRKALQEAYEVLYGQEQTPSWKAVKAAKGEHIPVNEKDSRAGVMEQFEHDWQNWEEYVFFSCAHSQTTHACLKGYDLSHRYARRRCLVTEMGRARR